MHVIGAANSKSRELLQAYLDEDERCSKVEGVVCWGVRAPTNVTGPIINNVPRLNALEQLTAFKSASIPTITWTTDVGEARSWVRNGELVFGRKIIHSQGTDIIGPDYRVRRGRDRFGTRWLESEWWSKVEKDIGREWRVHIFNGRSIARGAKVQTGESWRKLPVRNRSNGWTMVHNIEPSTQVRETSKAAVVACGYEFGAVDLLEDTAGRVVVLEVNLAPGLDDSSAGAYCRQVRRFVTKRREE